VAEAARLFLQRTQQPQEATESMSRIIGNSISEIVNTLDQNRGPIDNESFPVPHMLSFQGILGSMAKVYRPTDEALRNSWQSAIAMRNDCGLMECLEARQRCTALLDWQLVPEDAKSQEQLDLCTEMTRILQRIPRFTEYRRVLLEALWYGRYGIQNRFRKINVGGVMRKFPGKLDNEPDSMPWKPINGDKLVFRFDDGNLRPEIGQYPDQLGIRVSSRFQEGALIAQKWRIENVANAFSPTDQGMAYFLGRSDRQQITIHKHMIEDGDYYSSETAGSIHGVGIRSRIYWDWFQKQECLAFLMEYLERSAGGIEMWEYPAGNADAEKAVKKAAQERVSHGRNILFVPKPAGEDAALFGVQVIEPGMAGIESLKDLLTSFFGHRIKRYMLGQILTSEADATGLGSGVAAAHIDTLLQIVRYDSSNLEETLSDELVRPIQLLNFPKSLGIHLRLKIVTEDQDVDKKLDGFSKAYNMGAGIPEQQVLDMIGVSKPTGDEVVLRMPQQQSSSATGFGQDQPGGSPAAIQPVNPQQLANLREQLKQHLMSSAV